jgi:hypothetical protein
LYNKLYGRIARFQARLERTGLARQIRDACTDIRIQLRRRGQRQRRRQRQPIGTPGAVRKQWTEKWIGQPIEQWDEREKQRVLQNWTARWKENYRKKERVLQPDRPREPPDNSRRHNTEQSSAEAPFRATKGRELSASAGTHRSNWAVEISLQSQGGRSTVCPVQV